MKLRGILLAGLSLALAAASCTKLDDIQAQLDQQNARITALEALCVQMNTSITNLIAITDAIKAQDYVKNVEEITEEGEVTGYKITFGQGKTIIIPAPKDGKTPDIGVKEEDGVIYWTLNGEWLLDKDGNKLRVEGVTPQFKIEDAKWYVSYDKGNTWTEVGAACGDPLIKEVNIEEDSVTFVLADGQTFSLALNLEVNFNIPYGIVMLTSKLEGLHNGDTTSISIRVNPSNFPLKAENVDLFATHDIYSCFTEGPMPAAGYPEVFDDSVESDFEVLGLREVQPEEGIYEIAFTVAGNGNYYDDANVFAIAKNTDSEGDERSVCSATSCTVNVTPRLSEGIFVDSPVQSFYDIIRIEEQMKYGRLDTTAVKPFYVGLWSKGYINKSGNKKYYDRSDVVIKGVSTNTCSLIDSQYYQEYGFVTVHPIVDSTVWKQSIAGRDSIEFVEISDATISVNKSGVRSESAELPFGFKTFFAGESATNKTLSIEKDSIKTKPLTIDYTDFRTSTGYDEFVAPWFSGINKDRICENCNIELEEIEDHFIATIMFGLNRQVPGEIDTAAYLFDYSLSKGQSKDGEAINLPSDVDGILLHFDIFNRYLILD